MTTIPSDEPLELRAGDTWKWERTDLSGDYPAPTWTLKYSFKKDDANFEIAAAANGTGFLVTVAMATTAGYPEGRYYWVAFVESGTERFQVDKGWLEVLPSYVGTKPRDEQGHARKMLDAIEAVLEKRATKDQEEYSIGSRTLKRMPIKDLLHFRNVYRAEVRTEEGLPGGKLVVKF